MRGSEFVRSIWDMPMGPQRMEAVYQAVLAGHHLPQSMSKVSIGARGYIEVTDDYFAIGIPEDFVRIPCDAPTTQRIFNHLGLLVPTAKMVRMIHSAAHVKLAPQAMGPPQFPWDDSMTTVERFVLHNQWVEKQRGGRTGLVSGHKKDVVVTNRTAAQPGRLPIFGWIKAGGKETQPLSLFHEDEYTDYAEGQRGVFPVMRLDGVDRSVEEILLDPALATLLSHEGRMWPTTTRLSISYAPTKKAPSVAPVEDDDKTPAAGTAVPVTAVVSGRPTLRRGSPKSVAEHIKVWQNTIGVEANGDFDPGTEAATKVWQKDRGLKPDGVVGPITWRASSAPIPFVAKTTQTAVVAPVTRSGGDVPGVKFIEAKHYQKTTGRKIDGVVLHTGELPEKPTSAEGLGAYFKNPPVKASATYSVDNDSIVQSVLERDVAYAAPGSNHNMIQIEHAGYAKQTATEWADDYSTAMLELSAKLVAGICLRYDIPIEFVDRKGLVAGKRGITTHHEVSQAFKRSDHYDPGPNFPIVRYLELVKQFYEAAAEDPYAA